MISIVIPTYNRVDQLLELIGVVDSSGIDACEILVVDDNSSDGTDVRINALIASGSMTIPLRYLRNEVNCGASYSRNVGLREGKGDFLLYIDSDCVVLHETLNDLCNQLDEGDLVFPAVRDPDGTLVNPANEWAEKHIINSTCFSIRKSFQQSKELFFDENIPIYAEDLDFFLRSRALGGKVFYARSVSFHHPERKVRTENEYYLNLRNSLYVATKLAFLVPYRSNYLIFIAGIVVRALQEMITLRFCANMRISDIPVKSTRFRLFGLFFKALGAYLRLLPAAFKERRELRAALNESA